MLCMFIRLQFGFTHRPGHSPSQVYYLGDRWSQRNGERALWMGGRV